MTSAPTRRFVAVLLVIVGVALAVRVTFVLTVSRHDEQFYDAAYYELQARAVADGRGYNDPFEYLPHAPHRDRPAADHPPLTVFALIPVAWIGDGLGLSDETSQLLMRFEIALVGVGAVFLIGLLGRAVAGDRAGWIAAGIAAVYPYLWVNDGLIMSEAFAVAAVTGALILALRLAERPSWRTALWLGLVCGVAALARAELVLLAPLLGLPMLFGTFRRLDWSRRFALVGVLAGGTALVIGPWILFNLSRFEEPTLLSTNDGIAMLGSNCKTVFWGPATGLTDLGDCIPEPEDAPKGDQSVVSRIYRQRAIDFVNDGRRQRFLEVLAARVGRDWSVFRPTDMLSLNEAEGRPRWVTAAGLWFYYPLLALAIGGIVVLKRRRVRQWPLLVPPIVVTLGAVLSYGQTRFRVPAEPTIVVLAAVALAALWSSLAQRAQSSTIAASSSS
ncbi:MAG: glycosyl transferase [Actinobacteria bacterium]|nr:glycosyl transferase [Actinomycetota bacterium]